MSTPEASQRGLNILCIDNGGARGLSAILLIQAVMNRVQELNGLEYTPEPYEYFDLIAGAGTGGIQACMLGRLRMPIHVAIEYYVSLAKKNIITEKRLFGSRAFKTAELRNSLSAIVGAAIGNSEEPMVERHTTEEQCKTLVFAMSKSLLNADTLTYFRSYLATTRMAPGCTIWEAMCATMAHSDLFDPIEIGEPPSTQSFVDAGLGCSNPLDHVLAEVKTMYPTRHVSSVLSIGAGHACTVRTPDPSMLPQLLPMPVMETMKTIPRDSERVAEEVAMWFNSTEGVYFRLNANQGVQGMDMDESEQPSEVAEYIRTYMSLVDVDARISQAAQAIKARKLAMPTTQIGRHSRYTAQRFKRMMGLGPAESSKPSGPDGCNNTESDGDARSQSISKQTIESQGTPQKPQPRQGLNILCIDGGGTSFSSLLLLQEMMNRLVVQDEVEKPQAPLRPSAWFDVVAGTGTGGFSACMLGKLGMSVEEAIKSHRRLMEAVCSSKNDTLAHGAGPHKHKGAMLQKTLQSIIQDATGDRDKKMTDDIPGLNTCNTIIFAMLKHHMNAGIPTMFRSYRGRPNPAPDCAMWESIYATMAHPRLFESIDITENSVKHSFIGGVLGCSNPLAHVLTEVRDLYRGRHVSCILSIGAGRANIINIPNSGCPRSLGQALQNMVTDSERVAEEMERRFQDTTGVYFRFNVDQGVQDITADDWKKEANVAAHTRAYTRGSSVNRAMGEAVKAIHSRNIALAVEWIDGRIPNNLEPVTIKNCPIPVAYYTGLLQESHSVGDCIVDSAEQRRVCVIHGLGGAGKSQLAYKAIEQNHHHWAHIIYVEAASREAIEGSLQAVAKVKSLGTAHTYTDTLQWLQKIRSWLLVFDGADDPNLDIAPYFPPCYHGSIIITTRLATRACLAMPGTSVYHVSSMDPKDASSLLLRVVNARAPHGSPTTTDEGAADELVKDFGYLALAIVHAGAYIAHSAGMNISDYHNRFRKRRREMLEKYKTLPGSCKIDNYKKTVYTTWNMCYELLEQHEKLAAQKLLRLIAFLHHKDITKTIFQRAAANIRHYSPVLQQTEFEAEAHAYLQGYLIGSDDSDDEEDWVTTSFVETISELVAYSLVEFDRKNLSYNIHILVQDWARTLFPRERNIALEHTALLLSASIGTSDNLDSHCYRKRLGLHVSKILSEPEKQRRKEAHSWEVNANHAVCFAEVFKSLGLWQKEECLRKKVMEAREEKLGPKHPAALQSMDDLAHNYKNQSRLDEAAELYERVLTIRRNDLELGEGHEDMQASMKYLAAIYHAQKRPEEAERLWTELITVYKRSREKGKAPNDQVGDKVLGEMLACMGDLAEVYLQSKQPEKGEALRQDMLDVMPDDDPDKPMCMRKLAEILESKGRWADAEKLLIQSADALNRLWGERHLTAIAGQRYLYDFRIRRESTFPVACASCTIPVEAVHLCPSSKYVCKILACAFWSLPPSLAILMIAYLLPMCSGPFSYSD
ncbi:unnamed protein product [Rhizoctonia solani]|uniref:PNPLA domain-containing protein n=1 Tax=Rhizoctonia solani TaxID=456999 RepID=A0A8H3D024_9AGAM|nr:unnamed protein product [Rhizoctonia solani]